MNKIDLLIVVPAYNEEKSIAKTYFDLFETFEGFNQEISLIVVNDGSIDSTQNILNNLKIPNISFPTNVGVAQILIFAVQMAQKLEAHSLVICDADGQHLASEIKSLRSELQDHPYVIGVRDFEQYKIGAIRHFAIRVISDVLKRKTLYHFQDPTSGFRIYSDVCFPIILKKQGITEYLEDTVGISYSLAKVGMYPKQVTVEMRQRFSGRPSTVGLALILRYCSILFRLIVGKDR